MGLIKKHKFIMQIINGKTLYPHLERKSKLERYFELHKIYRKIGVGVVQNYNKYGLDIKNHHKLENYIDASFLHANGIKNAKPKKYNYITADKFLTYCYLSAINPAITPKVTNLLIKGKSNMPSEHSTIEEIIDAMKENDKLCFKLAYGCGGVGFYLVEKVNNEIVINKGKKDYETFLADIKKNRYIIQEFVKQHPDIANINSSSVNTLRIVTVNVKGKYKYLASIIRCGVSEKECVDNASRGGIFIGIRSNGTLREYGYRLYAPPVKKHPSSKIEFKGYTIPFFKEAVNLALKYHKYFPDLPSLGWDIAITETGPIIIEINAGWQTNIVQMSNLGLRKRVEEIFGEDYLTLQKRTIKKMKKNNK